MYVKVYFSRMEMTQESILAQNLLKITIFLRKWQKITFFGPKCQNKFGQPTTRNFEFKKKTSYDKCLGVNFCQKNHFESHFLVKIVKIKLI